MEQGQERPRNELAPVLPCQPNPYNAYAWLYAAGEEARSLELCALLTERSEGDRAWLRRTVLSTGGTEEMLRPDLDALLPLWQWVLAQIDEGCHVVPNGWYGEWDDPAEETETGRYISRLRFLGQAVAFQVVHVRQAEQPELAWVPYRSRAGERDPCFLVPTVADESLQSYPPMGLKVSMAGASPWLNEPGGVRPGYRAPDRLVVYATTLAEPPKRRRRTAPGSKATAAVEETTGQQTHLRLNPVRPISTTQENPREVYLYRADKVTDGVDPARCRPIDASRLSAGLTALGFTRIDDHESPSIEESMLYSDWILDQPDGRAVANALMITFPSLRPRTQDGIHQVEVYIAEEADEGMSLQERQRSTWWHAGVMVGLRNLATSLDAKLVTRDEYETAG